MTALVALGVVPAGSQTGTTATTAAPVAPEPPVRVAAGTLTPRPAQPRATRHVAFAGVIGSFTDSEPGAVRDSRAFVASAYRHVLGRPVDRAAELTWVGALDQRTPRSRLVAALVGSDEGRRHVVRRLYRAALGRAPSGADAGYWAGLLARGVSTDALRAQLYGSREFFRAAGGTNEGFVEGLFYSALGRAADRGGRAYHLRLLAAGASRVTVAGSLLGGDEARRRVVTDHYVLLLGRPPSSGRASAWVARLARGTPEAVLVAALVGSSEYLAALPHDYAATVSWAGSRAAPARLRSAGGGRVHVLAGRTFPAIGRVPVHIVVERRGGGTVAIDSTLTVVAPRNERFVASVYLDTLGRRVDRPSLADRLRELRVGGSGSRGRAALRLTASDEFRRKAVAAIYATYLGRAPSRGESGAESARVAFGASLDSVRARVAGSREYLRRAGGTVDGFLDALYGHVLGRAPDRAGRAYHTRLLAAGRSRSSVAAGLLASGEADGRVVDDLYARVLDRSPGRGERSYWTRALAGGLSEQGLLASLAASAEYFDRFPGAP